MLFVPLGMMYCEGIAPTSTEERPSYPTSAVMVCELVVGVAVFACKVTPDA
jgi:hypothetical protein